MEKKSLLLKILAPVLIIAVIGGMWLFNNQQAASKNPAIVQPTLPDNLKDAYFELRETEAIDFEKMT